MKTPRMASAFAVGVLLVLPLICASDDPDYIDKNSCFRFQPPAGWEKREFDDPRTKVEFYVPAPIGGRSKASLFFLSHPLSGAVELRAEADDRATRLRQMGSRDAAVAMVDFADTKAAQVEASMPRQNMRMKVLMFAKHGRSYTISFTATSQDFGTYVRVADEALKTFACIPPGGPQSQTVGEQGRIQQEKIRVWITALKDPDLGSDAYHSLLAAGKAAIPALEQAQREGTPLQKKRAAELLQKIREQNR